MKYTTILLIAICSMMISCAETELEHNFATEKVDHQKEYLEFLPVKWETNLTEAIEDTRHWMLFSSNPVVYRNLVIVPLNRDGIVALDQETGERVWYVEDEDKEILDLLGMELIGDILLLKGSYSTIALDPSNGSIIWEQYYEHRYGNTQFIKTNGEYLYKRSEDEFGRFHIESANIADGVWERIYSAPELLEVRIGAPSQAFSHQGNQYLAFGTANALDYKDPERTLHLLNVSTSSIVWSHAFNANFSTTVKVIKKDNHLVLFNNQRDNSYIKAYNIEDGSELWKEDIPSYYQTFPLVLNDYLYLQAVQSTTRINLTTGEKEESEKINLGHTDVFERDGKLYYGGFHHSADFEGGETSIGAKIAVVDEYSMELESTILPQHRNNTTINDEPFGEEIFDNDYSYVGRDMVFSQDGKYIFINSHNEVICMQLQD